MAQVVTVSQCGDMLAIFLGNRASVEKAKDLAKVIGYNDSPFFGAEKKRATLVSELVMLYSALAIFASNAAFNQVTAKAVIDSFLSHAKGRIYSHLEKQLPLFSDTYAKRMEQYFPIFQQEKAPLGLSFALMQHLGLNPLKNLHGQLWLTTQISMTLDETIEVMKGFTIIGLPTAPPESDKAKKERASRAVEEFMTATSRWNSNDKLSAMTIVTAAMQGDGEAVAPMMQDLTIDQARVVARLLEKLDE